MSFSPVDVSTEPPPGGTVVDATALPEPVRMALVDRAVLRCVHAGYRRVALFGAGRHTRWMGLDAWSSRGVEIVA